MISIASAVADSLGTIQGNTSLLELAWVSRLELEIVFEAMVDGTFCAVPKIQ